MTENKKTNRDPVILERRYVPKGAVVMRQGDQGSNAFLVQSGQVRVYTSSADGREVELARMGVGQIFGEMALIFDGPRTATVEAVEDCNLIVITRETMNEKLQKSDPTIRAIMPMLIKRLVQSNNALLNREGNAEDLIDAVNSVYQNLHAGVPRSQQAALENQVLPRLQEFLDAVRTFQKRYAADK